MPTADERLGLPPVDLLWIYAHPDDEAFSAAGTMAWAREHGLRTAYICATRGEAGGIRDSRLATPDTLGAVREHELRQAMSLVGLSELRLLGFRDSGMEGTPANDDARALIQQPPEDVLTHLVGHIRDLRPATVVTFGPEGIYGHPDHIMIGKIATRAVELAADEMWLPDLYEPWRTTALYHSAAPREFMLAMAEDPNGPLSEISEISRQNLGTPIDQITHWLDVSRWIDLKRRVMTAHATQIDPDELFEATPDAPELTTLGIEPSVRQPLPWDMEMTAADPLTLALDEIGRPAPSPDEILIATRRP